MELPPEKPLVVRCYCPGCEPFADGLQEILDVRWCETHLPTREGADDALVTSSGTPFGSAEAGGDGNRLWCELLHPRTVTRKPRARPPRRDKT